MATATSTTTTMIRTHLTASLTLSLTRSKISVALLLVAMVTASLTILNMVSTELRQQRVLLETTWGRQAKIATTGTLPPIPNPAKVVGFYNMYIPISEENNGAISETVQDLIQDQLGQVAASHMAEQQHEHGDGLILYTIALGHKVDDAWLNQTCQSVVDAAGYNYTLTCILLAHHESGSEMITLTHLHDYCVQHEDESVVYLHNKGSFNPNPTQDRWRQAMTAAVTSQLCYEAVVTTAEDDAEALLTTGNETTETSLCSLLYQPLPGLHVVGNIWTARCSYIAKLLPPYEFAARGEDLVDGWINAQRQRGQFAPHTEGGRGLFAMVDWFVGRDRFVAEHWVASHPDVEPCDVSFSSRSIEYWKNTDRNLTAELIDVQPTNETRSMMSPRYYNYTDDYVYHTYLNNPEVWSDEGLRKNDYFLLRGMIFRWLTYYGSLPGNSSYVWDWFPDGDYWKERVLSAPHTTAAMAAYASALVAES